MDTSSALPAAAAAHLGAMARVPDSTRPVDFSPGNPGDFAALLAAQPAPSRAPAPPPVARGAAGNDAGRGGNLPDSGKRLPSGAAAGRSRSDGSAEPTAGAAAATARREARNAASADATDDTEAGDLATDEAACDADGRADRASRAARVAEARLDAATPAEAMALPPAATDPAVPPAFTALAATASTDLADATGAAAGGASFSADDAATPSLAAEALAASRGAGTEADADSPLGRMIAAAREGGAGPARGSATDLASGMPEALGRGTAAAGAAFAGLQATTDDLATADAAVLVSPGAAEGSRGHQEGKPAAGGAVRLEAPLVAGNAVGGGTAGNAGDAANRQGQRESPPGPLPVAAPAAGSTGGNGASPADLPATPSPVAAPPAGLSALAANAALAALRSAAAGGATGARAGVTVEGTPTTVAGLTATGADLFAGGAAMATPPPGLLAGLAPPPGSAVNSPRAAVEVHAPPGSPAFADELAGRVAVLVQQDAGGATLKLNPGHLGPIEVRVQVRDGEATVMFAAHHATTREALEGAAPRLRELLVQQGYTQVNVDVAAQGQDLAQRQAAWNQARADGGAGREGRGPWRDAPDGVSEAGGAEASRPRTSGPRGAGRLDAFA